MFRWHSGDMVGDFKGIRISKTLAFFGSLSGFLMEILTVKYGSDSDENCTMEAEGFKTSAYF